MKNRQALISLAIGATALIAVGIFMLWKFSNIIPEDQAPTVLIPQIPNKAVAVPAVIDSTPLTGGPAAIVADSLIKKTLKDATRFYDYEVNYPQLSGYVDVEAEKNFNEKMSYDAATSVASFTGYYSDTEIDFSLDPGRGFFEETYELYPYRTLLNILVTGSQYTGGAHPASLFRTYAFDVEENRFLELKDLFRPQVNYLAVISDYAIKELNTRGYPDADWINSGAKPSDENYQLFNLEQDGLHIIFPPYQVAAYAAGPQEVVVPHAELQGLLQDKFLN